MLPNRDELIFREMMAHTPLFAHRNPQQIVIAGNDTAGILQETLKHTTVQTIYLTDTTTHEDPRVKPFSGTLAEFIQQAQPDSLDVVIISDQASNLEPRELFAKFHADGILIQLCDSPFEVAELKARQQQLKAVGFDDVLTLNFSQPHFASGWRSAIMAIKEGNIKRPREKDIFNKTFATRYYNLDMHRAAFALPEFMREELAE